MVPDYRSPGIIVLAGLGVWLASEQSAAQHGMQYPVAEQKQEGVAMQIKPNKTILQGKVSRVERSADGWGADVDIAVENSTAAEGYLDFVQAKPGSTVTVFAAEPGAVEVGKDYTLTTKVLGGPKGERVVIESVDVPKR
ncbi:hypothetical protein [Bradyrhizobium sp. OK095]|uniref:hypothetical protein n=1 Tax=Bradyrhizobium sp. OK095 TaxID=1882760 RepID=UPI00115F9AB0|nr:hypothetical protein [Bradyrhizobium sp. OK095]